jgi:hypothetical protein
MAGKLSTDVMREWHLHAFPRNATIVPFFFADSPSSTLRKL